MAAPIEQAEVNGNDTDDLSSTLPFHQLDAYPWDDDQEFQGGLHAILGSVHDRDPAQVAHLTLRAKCYYYARKAGTHVDFEGYKRWVEDGHGRPQANGTHAIDGASMDSGYGSAAVSNAAAGDGGMGSAPKPASFAEICDMIAEGKPIPGIKDIPDTILEGQASESQAARRKKPWEKENQGVPAGGAAEGEKLSWMR
jgi:hypothetical protein